MPGFLPLLPGHARGDAMVPCHAAGLSLQGLSVVIPEVMLRCVMCVCRVTLGSSHPFERAHKRSEVAISPCLSKQCVNACLQLYQHVGLLQRAREYVGQKLVGGQHLYC
jgi:hypothetical protein